VHAGLTRKIVYDNHHIAINMEVHVVIEHNPDLGIRIKLWLPDIIVTDVFMVLFLKGGGFKRGYPQRRKPRSGGFHCLAR